MLASLKPIGLERREPRRRVSKTRSQKQSGRSASDGIDQVAACSTGADVQTHCLSKVTSKKEQQREAAAGDGAVVLISQERRLSKSRKSR
jgi:hypothetical protein